MKRIEKTLVNLPWLYFQWTFGGSPFSFVLMVHYLKGDPPDDSMPFEDEGSPREFTVDVRVLWFGVSLAITGKVPKA